MNVFSKRCDFAAGELVDLLARGEPVEDFCHKRRMRLTLDEQVEEQTGGSDCEFDRAQTSENTTLAPQFQAL